MKREEMVPVTMDPATMWTLNADKRSVRLTLPPLPVAGQARPLFVALDFEAATVEEMIDRLTVLRAEMLPAVPKREINPVIRETRLDGNHDPTGNQPGRRKGRGDTSPDAERAVRRGVQRDHPR
jgi:hypothetical protein